MSSGIEGEVMDLDLNQEPSDSPGGSMRELAPWLNELETVHGRIEERIRQLEAIVSRIRERQMSRPLSRQITQSTLYERSETSAGFIHEQSRERLTENGMISKNHHTYLIAKALGMEKTTAIVGGYFDCNVCLKRAEDPVLTCCGHLFCWPCFYGLPYSYSNVKECPACDGEVTDTEVIPIYGNGNHCNDNKPKSKDSGVVVPPRPRAKRVESIRQKVVTRAIPFLPTHETIQRMRRAVDTLGQQTLPQGEDIGMANTVTNGGRQNQSLEPLRLFPPPLPPISSSPGPSQDSLERSMEGLDGFAGRSNVRRNRRRSSRVADRNSSQSVRPVILLDSRNLVTASETGSSASVPTESPREFAVSDTPVETRNLTVVAAQMGPAPPSASFSRRRTEASDVDSGPWTRSRRRRLR